jgi:hypothetical protein
MMRRQQDLQVKLRERLRRLLVVDCGGYDKALKLTRQFIASDPLLVGLLAEAARAEPELDVKGWVDEVAQPGGAWGAGPDWPHETEAGQATLIWALVQGLADDVVLTSVGRLVGERSVNDAVRRFTEMYIAPMFDFLIEQVGEQSSVLHALDRYVRAVEWFHRDDLLARYVADTQHGEAIYDLDLREFLFNQGIDMPFSQARSPSGDSDALSQLDTDDPLVCELKLFDGMSKDKQHVASGLHQAHQYAIDYGKTDAHLVIMNLSGRPLELPADGDDAHWPRYLDVAGVRIFLVPVRGKRLASASKLGKPEPVVFTRSDLVEPD